MVSLGRVVPPGAATKALGYPRTTVLNGSRNVLRRKVARLHNPPSDVPVWSAEHNAVRCDVVTGRCERIWDADRSRQITFPPMF